MSVESELKKEWIGQGADFVCFVDVSKLPAVQTKQYPNAIVVGISLSPGFIQDILQNKLGIKDEFNRIEAATDKLADDIADHLKSKGYSTYSQSEINILATGFYNENTRSTPLPHKTIAGLAGIGWIGNHNLLVSREFGSAISLCTVLTDAPLETTLHTPASSQCGSCTICKDACPTKAITGNIWGLEVSRDEIIDVEKCNSCLICLAICPWTQKLHDLKYRKGF
ncbi:MAG: epoxyqueuosine reductase [Bacteroidetes bacterium]|nr:epoxyqueuosine reductase [Bacteroidota bacterium]